MTEFRTFISQNLPLEKNAEHSTEAEYMLFGRNWGFSAYFCRINGRHSAAPNVLLYSMSTILAQRTPGITSFLFSVRYTFSGCALWAAHFRDMKGVSGFSRWSWIGQEMKVVLLLSPSFKFPLCADVPSSGLPVPTLQWYRAGFGVECLQLLESSYC